MAATYTGPITMLDSEPYTKGMTVAQGTFAIGLYSPGGSTGWRGSLTILVNGKKKLVHLHVMDSDLDALSALEYFKKLRQDLQQYGNNNIMVQVAHDDALVTYGGVNTFQELKDAVDDNVACRLRGAVPMCGVSVIEHLYAGEGGYVAAFTGSLNGVRCKTHLGTWRKTPEGMEAAGRAWDKAARAAGYREARLNFRD
ncbi:thioredoxin domain-containing [Chlorella sorokiniana]|uniref:Thioredoxin domain-containing n=1 Tax=Chlorella sorokiniana TaxID=3076 RepID=A0A2P6TSQ2_CHLSO|nr:thioredoxin domain-containing [Chlorella sorokiniana]|eukprot:PRW57091.1 thioredoxin domain-containing [Chlorella sorokiniana]